MKRARRRARLRCKGEAITERWRVSRPENDLVVPDVKGSTSARNREIVGSAAPISHAATSWDLTPKAASGQRVTHSDLGASHESCASS